MIKLHSLCLALALFLPLNSQADDDIDLLDAAQYAVGTFGTFYLHDVGHQVALKMNGIDEVEIEVPSLGGLFDTHAIYDVDDSRLAPESKRVVAVSGLIATNLASELALSTISDNAIGQGIISSAQFSNIAHVYRYYAGDMGSNDDLGQYEAAGGNPHILSAALMGYTAINLMRMKNKDVPLFGINLNF